MAVPRSTGGYCVPQLLPRTCGWCARTDPRLVSRGLKGCPCSGSNTRCCWSRACVLILPLLRAPQVSYPGASSLSAHQPAPFRAHGLVLQRGSRCAGVPMLPRGCSLAGLRCPCPACALNFCHTSPL